MIMVVMMRRKRNLLRKVRFLGVLRLLIADLKSSRSLLYVELLPPSSLLTLAEDIDTISPY